MGRYRKRPVIVEAFQFDGDLRNSDGEWYVPEWMVKAYEEGTVYWDSLTVDTPPCELFVNTLEGPLHISVGDYVIQGVKGEIYPCKPDIFEATYSLEELNY